VRYEEFTIKKGIGYCNGVALPFKRSPNIGGSLKPRYIVIHDTASGLKDDGDIAWLTDKASKVSAHVVVSREGKVTQLVPFNVVAWHAGQSQWKGLKFLNSYAVGIEIDNPGKLQKVSEGVYKNDIVTIDTNKNPSLKVSYAKTSAHGAGYWLEYTSEQIETVKRLCTALCVEYRIEDILTHWMISPGRKIDTNPTYPLDKLRAAALGSSGGVPLGFMTEAQSEDGERTDTDESGEKFDEDHRNEKSDESHIGAFAKVKQFIKGKIAAGTGIFGGLSLSSLSGVDWKVIAVVGAIAVIGLAIWIWSERE
jgi:N-acetyl-anhydromuramyl-L-alanine amidase AmpD